MKDVLFKMDEPSRRRFLATAAKSMLGVSFLPAIDGLANSASAADTVPKATAKHVIYLFMAGGMSQLDTFDPKPDSDVQGDTKAIATSVPGIQVSEYFPKVAKLMKGLAIVRSLTTETGAHEQGQYLMRTAYRPLGSIRHPSLAAWSNHTLDSLNPTLPGAVVIGNSNKHPLGGFLQSQDSPVPISSAKAGLKNTKPPKYLADKQFQRRLLLSAQFDRQFRKKYQNTGVEAYTQLYREAAKLLKSRDLQAFDISLEPDAVKKKYGENALGQGCLLARRLVEEGVRFVEVEFGGWDHHRDLNTGMASKAGVLDQALEALLRDLVAKDLFYDTLVVVASEFGRTPKINENAGRDHHPGAYSCLLAGGGIRGGQVYGATDEIGSAPADNPASPADLNATIAQALGIPTDKRFFSPSKRPFTVANEGSPITELFG
jgi:uncharacterized protein (DUF1501 family)